MVHRISSREAPSVPATTTFAETQRHRLRHRFAQRSHPAVFHHPQEEKAIPVGRTTVRTGPLSGIFRPELPTRTSKVLA